jgi:hypothetical protein
MVGATICGPAPGRPDASGRNGPATSGPCAGIIGAVVGGIIGPAGGPTIGGPKPGAIPGGGIPIGGIPIGGGPGGAIAPGGIPIGGGGPAIGPGGAIGGFWIACASELPQLRQNFMPGGLSPRQTGHVVGNPGGGAGVGAWASELPQFKQNDDPGGLSWPHVEQRITPLILEPPRVSQQRAVSGMVPCWFATREASC